MAVLPDQRIRELCKTEKPLITPFDPNLLSPASYDIRVGVRAIKSVSEKNPLVNLEEERILQIGTGEFAEILTLEKLNLPRDVCGRFGLRSYFSRKGLILFGGAQVDPGFSGHLVVSVFNTGPRPIILRYGEPFCTIEFNKLESPSEKPYTGTYQNQEDFPSENIEFIVGARGVTLYEVVQAMQTMRTDLKWIKWLLALILAAMLGQLVVSHPGLLQ